MGALTKREFINPDETPYNLSRQPTSSRYTVHDISTIRLEFQSPSSPFSQHTAFERSAAKSNQSAPRHCSSPEARHRHVSKRKAGFEKKRVKLVLSIFTTIISRFFINQGICTLRRRRRQPLQQRNYTARIKFNESP